MTDIPKPSNVHRLVPATASASLPNPFRPGTKKAACYERFMLGGDSATLKADFRKLGAAGTTANTWLGSFRLLARTVRAVQGGGSK